MTADDRTRVKPRTIATGVIVVAIIVTRLLLTRNPLDWMILMAGLWGGVTIWGESRKVVSAFVLLMFFAYLKTQVLHMLAVADVIP